MSKQRWHTQPEAVYLTAGREHKQKWFFGLLRNALSLSFVRGMLDSVLV